MFFGLNERRSQRHLSMPRANRDFLPGDVWHITHRCHRKNFLLKFARDRCLYLRWLAKRKSASAFQFPIASRHRTTFIS